MYAATTSVALVGGDARPVEVQVHVAGQKEQFKLSGLPDTAVREAKDRVRAAITSSGIRFPNRSVTVNLAPARVQPGKPCTLDRPSVRDVDQQCDLVFVVWATEHVHKHRLAGLRIADVTDGHQFHLTSPPF